MGLIEITILLVAGLYIVTKEENKAKVAVYFGVGILFLLAALRHSTVGIDVKGYINMAEMYSEYDFSSLFQYAKNENIKDPVYYYTMWGFMKIFQSSQLMLAFIALLYSIAVGKLIYTESKQPAISVIMLVSLGFYYFSLTGLRQTIAMSILMLSYPFLKDRKLIPFLLCVILAGLYHETALIFVIIYPIANKRISAFHILVAIAIFIIFYLFRDWFFMELKQLLSAERYTVYISENASTLTSVGFWIQTVCISFSIYYYKNLLENDEKTIILFNIAYVGWLFQLFASVIGLFFRISYYFSIFNIILVANAVKSEPRDKTRRILEILMTVVFLLYMVRDGIMDYHFFWQEVLR